MQVWSSDQFRCMLSQNHATSWEVSGRIHDDAVNACLCRQEIVLCHQYIMNKPPRKLLLMTSKSFNTYENKNSCLTLPRVSFHT
jgi:hypothetical protein